MNNNPNKHQVPVTDRYSGKTRMSEPVTVHGPRQKIDTAMSTAPESTQLESKSKDVDGVKLEASSLPSTAETVNTQEPVAAVDLEAKQPEVSAQEQKGDSRPSDKKSLQAVGMSRAKGDIETLEQFIEHAYARKGKPLTLKPKVKTAIAQKPRLDDVTLSRLLALAAGDELLAVPRHLLLVSQGIEDCPALRAALGSFVLQVMRRQPIFEDSSVQAVLMNLPEALAPDKALVKLIAFIDSWVKRENRIKGADVLVLRQNAVNLFVTWLASNRGINADEIMTLLFQAVWLPASRDLADENARLRALTDVANAAGAGLVCERFRKQATEACFLRDQMQRQADELRMRLVDAENQCSMSEKQRDALQIELENLRVQTATEIAELKRTHDVERTHMHHGQEQLGGRLVRRLDDAVETLEVGLSALRNKTPRVEVMLERAEIVVDALREEIRNLKEE